jgi:DNA processing protein
LASKVLVGGTNTDAYQRAAVVPLRWGAPRILVLDRGLFVALGSDLSEEPFRSARLWRYKFDPETDLVISRNRPFDEYAPSNQKYRDDLLVALSDESHGVALRPGGNMDKLAKKAAEAGKAVTREG